MTIGHTVFLSLLYQPAQETVVAVEEVQEPPDSFVWFFGILAAVLFIGFYWWIRRIQNRS